ncbi:MAG: beta-N-acetylhexosaminidase [Chloroflexota bacterium]
MSTPTLSLIPIPAKVTPRAGAFSLTPSTQIEAADALRPIAERLRDELRPATGLPLPVVTKAGGSRITLGLDESLAGLGDEAYRLSASSDAVAISGARAAGVMHGTQTLRQLLPPAIFRRAVVPGVTWEVAGVEIEDAPQFSWRGSHLDVGRHFMPKATVEKHIDLLALHKLNVFHWHLTEDQGWRIEIKRYPKLTEVGAWRNDSMIPPLTRDPAQRKFAGVPHGGFYTQDDVREVVRYAADRGITVVPEIEMPGHALAAIAAYPELGNTGAKHEVQTYWGISEHVFGVGENVFTFLENVLDEVLALFPSKFIHVGGDECPKTEWKASAAAQARMKELGLKDEDELQSWFITRMDKWLAARGRRLIGWDEILEGGLAPGAAVMSWRGEKGGIAAAKAGHDVVMAPEKPTYFDYDNSENEPLPIRRLNTLAEVYAYEPVPKELGTAEAKHVLGAQGQLWTEYMPDQQRMEYMAWPRLCALAEVLWSPKETRDAADFTRRLDAHLERLRILDVNYWRPRR